MRLTHDYGNAYTNIESSENESSVKWNLIESCMYFVRSINSAIWFSIFMKLSEKHFLLLLLIFVAIYRENEGLTALFTEPVIHKTS